MDISNVEQASSQGVDAVKAGLLEHFTEIREMIRRVGEGTAAALTAEREVT